MTTQAKRQVKLDGLVAYLANRLPEPAKDIPFADSGRTRKFKAKSIAEKMGLSNMSARAWRDLEKALGDAGIYTDRILTDPGLRRDELIAFAKRPFPPVELFFRKESALKNYLIGGIGRFGPLQNLRRARSEHKLPSGHRVDILCEENRRDGKGALVAIELKRDKSADAVSKLNQYLVELQREHADRSVRGMIISGSASDADVKLVGQIKSVPIDWYIYTLELKKV